MFNSRSNSRSSWTACSALAGALLAMAATGRPLAAQQSVSSFINGVDTSINSLTAGLVPGKQPLIFGGENMLAYGSLVLSWTPQVEMDYVDGLKAAGVQRVEFNPGVMTINQPVAVTNLDAMVRHTRQLGMQLAINPEFLVGELTVTTFDDFTAAAMQTYPQLAARYQPDNFVIVHEPTTQTARMGITATPEQWVAFIQAVGPLIKAASPRTRVGAGDCTNCNEQAYFSAFVALPTCSAANSTSGCLDFMTMDLYSDSAADFLQDTEWAQLAQNNGKGVYMEETWAPHDLPSGISVGQFQASPTGAEGASLVGSCDTVFETMDQDWLSGMAQFDRANGMESMTAFTTQAFFLYVTAAAPLDQATNGTYLHQMATAVQKGQLTPTATSYGGDVQQVGIRTVTSISNASYATLPSVFNPSCGSANNPCNPNSTVAPDMIVSAFGADLANQTVSQSDFPISLGGTTATLLDSANKSLPVQIYSVTPTQINYLVPSTAAPGPASLTVTSGDGTVTTGIVLVAPVAPGLYTSYSSGSGPAAGIAVCVGTCSGWPNSQGNGQFWQYTFVPGCTGSNCEVPLSWGPNDTVAVELYMTGLRHVASASNITANIQDSAGLLVWYAGPQGVNLGLDQANVPIPQSFRGAGQVVLSLTAQYTDPMTKSNYAVTSNLVTLDLK